VTRSRSPGGQTTRSARAGCTTRAADNAFPSVFTFSYSGISEDEALALAEKFGWKAIQTAAQAK